MKENSASKSKKAHKRTVLITGAHGFIGSNLARYWLKTLPWDRVIALDSLTYAARPDFLRNFEHKGELIEEIVDIRDHLAVARVMQKYKPEVVLHLAAESHVCRSIAGPKAFVETNVLGTFHLLEEFRHLWRGETADQMFVHVSTDEVFGDLGPEDPPFTEKSAIRPTSPYASSKASSDLLALSYWHTYGVPVVVTNCSNNYGPNQHEEKLVAGCINRILKGEEVKIFGNGHQVRDWLFVEDHCRALRTIVENAKFGERYCIGGENELRNLEMLEKISSVVDRVIGSRVGLRIKTTNDRPTDDRRYAINCEKIKALGWSPTPRERTEDQLTLTVQHYLDKLKRDGSVLAREAETQGVSYA